MGTGDWRFVKQTSNSELAKQNTPVSEPSLQTATLHPWEIWEALVMYR